MVKDEPKGEDRNEEQRIAERFAVATAGPIAEHAEHELIDAPEYRPIRDELDVPRDDPGNGAQRDRDEQDPD
jgi:hypothetical protein